MSTVKVGLKVGLYYLVHRRIGDISDIGDIGDVDPNP